MAVGGGRGGGNWVEVRRPVVLCQLFSVDARAVSSACHRSRRRRAPSPRSEVIVFEYICPLLGARSILHARSVLHDKARRRFGTRIKRIHPRRSEEVSKYLRTRS